MTLQPLAMPAQSPPAGTSPSSNTGSPGDVNEDQFLQLLVAQIHYQDPTNPTDATTFVTQLAQFSSLEQLVGIRADLDSQNSTQGGNQ